MSPAGVRRGFTLVELLVVVLIIGILAAIALPRFLGQRTRAKNAAAQAAARHALLAARSYYTQNSESYVGLGPTQLQGYESSLGTTEPGDGQTPGSSANPQNIWIGNGLDGTNPNTVAGGDPNGGSTVTLCSVSKGDTVYCVKDTSGVASYLRVASSSATVAGAASAPYSSSGWSGSAVSVASSGGCAGLTYSQCILAESGLVHYYKLDETSGTTVRDSVSSGAVNGTLLGSGTTLGVAGLDPNSSAYSFNTNGYINIVPGTALSGSFTVEMVVRTISSGFLDNGIQPLFTNNYSPWYFTQGTIGTGVDLGSQARWHGDIGSGSAWIANNNGAGKQSAFALPSTGTWYHYALTVNSTSWAQYINGALNDSGSYATANPVLYSASGAGSTLGIAGMSPSDWVGRRWGGLMQHIAIYNTKLSQTQVQKHYQALS